MAKEWKKNRTVSAGWNVHELAGTHNMEWDTEVNITQADVLERPTLRNIRKRWSELKVKFKNYVPMLEFIDSDECEKIRAKFNSVYEWLVNARQNKYDLKIIDEYIIPTLEDIDETMELLLQQAQWKFRLDGKVNRGLKANIQKMKDDLNKQNKKDFAEDEDEDEE